MDQEAHAGPEQRGDPEDEDEGQIGIETVFLDRDGQEHAREGDDRADREIDAAGQDHEGHADRDDAEEGIVGQKIADHPGRGEARKLREADQVADDEDGERDENRKMTPDHALALQTERTADRTGDWARSTASTTMAFTMRLYSGG